MTTNVDPSLAPSVEEILRAARRLIEGADCLGAPLKSAYPAEDARGLLVAPLDPNAVRFSIQGAIVRATFDLLSEKGGSPVSPLGLSSRVYRDTIAAAGSAILAESSATSLADFDLDVSKGEIALDRAILSVSSGEAPLPKPLSEDSVRSIAKAIAFAISDLGLSRTAARSFADALLAASNRPTVVSDPSIRLSGLVVDLAEAISVGVGPRESAKKGGRS